MLWFRGGSVDLKSGLYEKSVLFSNPMRCGLRDKEEVVVVGGKEGLEGKAGRDGMESPPSLARASKASAGHETRFDWRVRELCIASKSRMFGMRQTQYGWKTRLAKEKTRKERAGAKEDPMSGKSPR